MRSTLLLTSLAAVALWATTASAVDYAQIERGLEKEPRYESTSPQYALLLFGPQANLRVWAVLDHETLYVDRNGDGDLTAANERIGKLTDCKDLAVGHDGDPANYTIARASTFEDDQGGTTQRFLLVFVQITGPVSYRQYAGVALQDSLLTSHLAHFHGPLRIYPGSNDGRPGPEHVLRIGDEPVELDAVIGTIEADYGCWTVVEVERNNKSVFPEGVFPHVDIGFPPRTRGGPPIRQSYPLSGFC